MQWDPSMQEHLEPVEKCEYQGIGVPLCQGCFFSELHDSEVSSFQGVHVDRFFIGILIGVPLFSGVLLSELRGGAGVHIS